MDNLPAPQIPETRDLFQSLPLQRCNELGAWRLGRDLGADICLLDAGPVVAVSESSQRLINTSLPNYVRSLELVGDLRDSLRNRESIALIGTCEAQLRSIDEVAYAKGEYWALIIEQITDQQF